MFSWSATMDAINAVPVKKLMNKSFKAVYLDDSLRTVIKTYKETNLDTLPVVDHDERLVGVFPRRRLYTALLETENLDTICTPYIVFSPRVNHSENTFNRELMGKVLVSPIGNVPVIDTKGNLVGMIGKHEYLRESINMIGQAVALLESIFYAIQEGIIVVDTRGRVIGVNQTAEQMFGIDLPKIHGTPISKLFPEVDFSKTNFRASSFKRFRATVQSIRVLVSLVPIRRYGKEMAINVVFQDISEIENIAQELEITKELQNTLSGVLNASENGILVCDKSGVIKYANETAGKILHMPESRIVGHTINEYMPANISNRVAQTGLSEVDICPIAGETCVVSYVPIKEKGGQENSIGVVSTIFCEKDKLTEQIARKWLSLRQQVRYYREELEKKGIKEGCFDLIVSENAHFAKLKMEAERVARSKSTVLITGESGVGKDMFARAIHLASPRKDKPFLKVNCAAIAEHLMESELFGYVPGAFSGASKSGKKGYFERANKGTIFLDEIGDMPLALQVKLLQVLQEKQFVKVGATSPQIVDVRIIAATNRDLPAAIAKGTFRKDLYYRLNVIQLKLPSLRERPEDIVPLALSFINKYNEILGSNILGLSPEAQQALKAYNWPGNIRELENAVERAANYVWEGDIGLNDLPANIRQYEAAKPV